MLVCCCGVWFVDPGRCVVVVPVEVDMRGFPEGLTLESLSSRLAWETCGPGAGVEGRRGELRPHTGRPGAALPFLSPGLGLSLNLEQSPVKRTQQGRPPDHRASRAPVGGARTFKIALSHCCKSECKEDKGRPLERHTLWASKLTSDLASCCSNLWGGLSSFPAGLISSVLGVCCVLCGPEPCTFSSRCMEQCSSCLHPSRPREAARSPKRLGYSRGLGKYPPYPCDFGYVPRSGDHCKN